MKLIDASVRLPHTVVVVVLLCAIFGLFALQRIPIQLKPSVDRPEITITTTFRGASPFEVEEQITRFVEGEMDSVEGVKRITSVSQDGRSEVTLEFDWGVNKDTALIDVINKLNQVSDLPQDADEPVVNSVTSDQREPVMWLALESKTKTPNQLYEIVDDVIEPQLRRVPGVGNLWVFGGEEREMQIRISPDALVSRQITISQLIGSIRRENLNVRGGSFDEGKRRYSLRTVGQFTSPEAVGQIIVARTEQGAVYLQELAEVRSGYKKRLSQVRINGRPTVVMGVMRKTGANVVDVCREFEDRVRKLNQEFAQKRMDIGMRIAYTDVAYIDQAMDLAWQNLLIGAALASVVLLLFLRSWRSLLVVVLTIPVCLITVFILLYGLGRSLNIISLAGLAFCSGMIVDNAIVVTENIYRHLDMGRTPMQAAREATSEVWGAILISTLTTLVVFVPVIFIQEEAGQLFKDIAIAICLAIALSLLAAVTLIPMLASRLCRPASENGRVSGVRRWLCSVARLVTLAWAGRLVANGYRRGIEGIVGRSAFKTLAKLGIVALVVAVFVTSLRLLPSAEYLPTGNRSMVIVFAAPLVGSNLDKCISSIAPLENDLLRDQRVESFFSVFGQRFNAVGVIIKPEFADERSMKAFVGEMFGRCQGLHGFESLFPTQTSIFRDPGKQIEIDIVGPSLDRLQTVSKAIEGQLYQVHGVKFVRSSHHDGNPEVQIVLDRRRSAALGLRVSEVADFIESLVAGKYVGLYNEDGKQIDLTLYAQEDRVESRRSLAAVQMMAPSGQAVRLDTVATVRTTTGPTAINHVEKERSITLTVNLTDDVPLEQAITNIEASILDPMRQTLPSSYSLRLGGTADKLDSTLRALTGSFFLAVVIVYLLMVALFRSWVYPLVILVTIPMAMTGAFLGITLSHWASGGLVTFDVIAMLGLIILAGIVVNNAILIVHQTLNFRNSGLAPDEALRAATETRLRPICMSVSTSVLAMLPLALGRGAGAELYRGLGAVVIGGLAVSALFTLVLVPALLSLVQDIQAWLAPAESGP